MRLTFLSFAVVCIAGPAALAGGGTVTSTEPGPASLSTETTGKMLGDMGVVPASATSTVARVVYIPPPRKTAEQTEEPAEDVKVAEAEPLEPRKVVRQCTTCHGKDGIATIPTAPNIAGSSRVYLETQLKAFRDGKRENEVMSVIAEDLSDAEIVAAAQWYAALKVTVEIPE